MASRETLKNRAKIAARFSALMRTQEFYKTASKVMPVDSFGEYSVVVADPAESAVVTIHRMEQLREQALTLVTVLDERINVTFFRISNSAETPANVVDQASDEIVDIAGGMSVEEWLVAIDVFGKGKPFTVSGREFAAELTPMTLTSN